MMDGRGLYGQYETTGTVPSNLDACGGHTGAVPAYTVSGTTYPAASSVYHYHGQSSPPYTVGCFGPIASLTACKALYPTCGTGFETLVNRCRQLHQLRPGLPLLLDGHRDRIAYNGK